MDTVMEKLIEAGFEYLKDQVRWQTGMKEELERLRYIQYPKIQAVVAYASTQLHIKDQNSALNIWLWKLRDAIDEAEDVLDDLEYKKHEQQLAKNNKVRSTINSLKKIGKRALKIDPNLKRLEAAVQKLDKVSADVATFLHLVNDAKQEQRGQQLELYRERETGSLPKNDQIGRGKEKEYVMEWLRKPSNEEEHQTNTLYKNISLLSIVGHGGMGKTTLLQHVYDDEMTKEFDLKMWVCVSNNFDVKTVVAAMLKSRENSDFASLDDLQSRLKSAVTSKKFLLVLDDIWDEEEERDKSKWENVLAPLAYGSLGSKILVTTRMDSAASIIAKVIKKKKETLRLKGLNEAECLELLNSHAFAGVENHPGDHRKLKSIAGEIVKKLSGSPLAAKVMGGVLNSKLDESHWIQILNSDFTSAESAKNGIMPILRLSYIFLPKHLQSCFTFCCIFPQDHEFDKDELVQMWIALGFVQSSNNQGETMEDVGGRYFDVLVKKSFFDILNAKYYTYKMHDLLHELAQNISADECFRVEGNNELLSKIPETIRHLSVKTSNLQVLKKMSKFKNLRTLYVSYDEDNQDIVGVLAEIFKASISIRLLHITGWHLKMIPEEIGCLIHLRYLNLRYTLITLLPRSLSDLYHLQFIIFHSSMSLSHDFLPKDMNNLSNLHYLELPWDDLPGMHGIGKLNSLQELDGFYVKNDIGYRIGELEHMNDLRKLRIKFLENVKDAEEICSAKLCDKRNLINLSLEWGYIESRKSIHLDEKVLDNLKPQNCLKNLSIRAYMGIRFAIWMNENDLINNLEYIELDKCLELQTLPPLGKLPFLKSLYLGKMPKVKRLEYKFHGNDKDCVFPSLQELQIVELEALEDWFDATDDCLFPCLTQLHLQSCPNLHELPYLPPKLEILDIQNIGWKTLNCCSISKSIPLKILKVCSCPNITYITLSISKSIPLKILKVCSCPNITYITLANKIERLTKLEIRDCPNLISLGGHQKVETSENCQLILDYLTINDPSVLLMEPLRSITSIQSLIITHNDELVSFPNEAEQWFLKVSSSLLYLGLYDLRFLQSLPSSLESLSSLRTIWVAKIPQLQLLPNLPASLEHVQLLELESLQCLPSSLSTISALYLKNIPLLKSLPDLPPSLKELIIDNVPQLRELPDLPPSLEEGSLHIFGKCHPELERYRR